jgi:hypothetical protein
MGCSSCATRGFKEQLCVSLSCKGTDSFAACARCWFHFAHSWMRFWVADARKVTVSQRAAAAAAKSRREQDHPPVVCCAARAHKIQFNWKIPPSALLMRSRCKCMETLALSEILMRLKFRTQRTPTLLLSSLTINRTNNINLCLLWIEAENAVTDFIVDATRWLCCWLYIL